MSLTLKEMISRSRLILGDLSATKWSDPELVHYANEGMRELAKLIRTANQDFFQGTTTGTFSATTAPNPTDITLPSDFAFLKDIRITSDGYTGIEFYALDQSDSRFQSALNAGSDAYPGVFYYDILGLQTLRLAPGSIISLAYLIEYIAVPAEMTTPLSEPTGIPEEHRDWIVTYMVMECLRSRADERLIGFEEKASRQAARIADAVATRQRREPKYVIGYLEEEGW